MKTDFASAVALAREERSWTLEEIADRLQVSLHTVRAWLKPHATSRREAPEWAGPTLIALACQKAVSEVRRGVRITYEPLGSRGRP